jgi:hypothetical protein
VGLPVHPGIYTSRHKGKLPNVTVIQGPWHNGWRYTHTGPLPASGSRPSPWGPALVLGLG